MGKISTSPTIAGRHAATHEPGGEDPVVGVPPGAHAASHEPAGADEVNDIDIGNTGVLLSAHEARHIAGGADDIDEALDGRAIGFSEQGDIVYASAATTISALAHGAAGEALLTQGHGANPIWGNPATQAHVLATTGPHTNELPLTDLAAGVQGNIIHRGAADWAALAVGGAGDALLSGGAGVDVSWGAPDPAAHESTHVTGGSDDIDSALDGRAITLTTQGDIVYASGVNTLARLGAGTNHQLLETQGGAANPQWAWAGLEIQTQTGEWADPTGGVYEGRVVLLYNSTQVGYRLAAYMNSAWRNVDLLG